jgi:DNA-binding NtrC family response regulator
LGAGEPDFLGYGSQIQEKCRMESVAILLVDDEASVLQFFQNALTDAGFDVEMMLFAEAVSNVRPAEAVSTVV